MTCYVVVFVQPTGGLVVTFVTTYKGSVLFCVVGNLVVFVFPKIIQIFISGNYCISIHVSVLVGTTLQLLHCISTIHPPQSEIIKLQQYNNTFSGLYYF